MGRNKIDTFRKAKRTAVSDQPATVWYSETGVPYQRLTPEQVRRLGIVMDAVFDYEYVAELVVEEPDAVS